MPARPTFHRTVFAAVLLALAGCASGPSSPSNPSKGDAAAKAATTPLADLNLVHAPIPPALAQAQRGPYAAPAERSCAALASEVQALDAALGADLDTPPPPGDPGLVERGAGAAGDAAVGAIRSAAEGVVPFRGWVRKLSGAERYSREVAAAIAAGTVRRAYLKGVGQSLACEAPAAPRRAEAR